jgi:hypothetical protein
LSADQGNADGQNGYGNCLQHGHGIAQNSAMAVEYYKLSADQGNPHGQANYVRSLQGDVGVCDSAKAAPIQSMSDESLVDRICSFHNRNPSVSAAQILKLAKRCWPADDIHQIFECIYKTFPELGVGHIVRLVHSFFVEWDEMKVFGSIHKFLSDILASKVLQIVHTSFQRTEPGEIIDPIQRFFPLPSAGELSNRFTCHSIKWKSKNSPS